MKVNEKKLAISLEKILTKPVYISINSGCRIVGNFGHATAIFKIPVIEGQYYLEFVVREDTGKNKKTTKNSAVRVGICNAYFSPSSPLGYG